MIEGKAIVRFGAGDILVTPIVKEDNSSGCIVLQNKGTHNIGAYTRGFEKGEDDTIIKFENIESLEVVIERLECLKSMMQGNRDGCREVQYEY